MAGEHHWFATALGAVDQFRQVLARLAHRELAHDRLEAYVLYITTGGWFLA
jgi:hypothetical protein